MNREEFAAAKELFHRAVLLPEEERHAFLISDCPNPDLFETVRQLLEAEQRMGNRLNGPLFAFEARQTAPEEIGPYRVERELGRGGMATVFLARRADSLYDKPVAIKLIDRPLWRPEDIARFRREIRILASLSHPHIVGLLEGNRGSDGRLYLVMEFVEGQLLNEWKRSRSPSLEETMRVYLQLCDAVSYAHRNLIVHRDLKPSNVLVTPKGEAKLLDFGIAKLLGDEDNTVTGLWRMTVAYASPEQVRGDRSINVATDVYSLGVVLYELLTGQKPHGEGEATPQATMRAVLEMEPKSPRSLDASIPRELEAIVMKAMRKDATERYATVEELRLDCNRFLQGMPVEAMRGGQVYRLRKFAARHRATLTIAAIALGFATFGVASVLHYARQADARLRDVILVNQDIVSKLQLIPGRQQIELQLLRRSVEALERIWRSTRSMEAAEALTEALLEIGRTSGYPSVRGIGDTNSAERYYRLAVDVGDWMIQSNPGNPRFAAHASTALCALGAIFIEQNRYDEAERFIRRSVDLTRPDPSMPRDVGKEAAYEESLAHLSRIYLHNGNREECLRLRRQVVQLARARVQEDAQSDAKKFVLAGRLALLGWAQREFGQLEEALASYNESAEILRNATEPGQGFERRQVEAMNRQQIGRILSAMRRWKEAKLAFEASIAAFQRLREDDPLNVACQRGLAGSFAYLAAEEQRAAANHPLARQHAAEAIRLMKDLIAKDPLNQKAKEELREFETLLRLPGDGATGHR